VKDVKAIIPRGKEPKRRGFRVEHQAAEEEQE
jgi:hypothetical protein